jgi:hypothetical protein
MQTAEDFHYRDELLEKIIEICSSNKYKNIGDFEWYLTVLTDLTSVRFLKNEGDGGGRETRKKKMKGGTEGRRMREEGGEWGEESFFPQTSEAHYEKGRGGTREGHGRREKKKRFPC